MTSLVSNSVFGCASTECGSTLIAQQELKDIQQVCISLQNKKRPTREDVINLVRVCLKFHSGDIYYTYLEGSETIDSVWIRALVFGTIDTYIHLEDILECMFGDDIPTKREFKWNMINARHSVSTSMRSYASL